MTGSGNDFVMVDARHTTPEQWTAADIRAVCARGTGVVLKIETRGGFEALPRLLLEFVVESRNDPVRDRLARAYGEVHDSIARMIGT